MSVLGSIQPGPLRAYLKAALADTASADGLMQRFQLAVYPDLPGAWRNVDRWPDSPARKAAYDLIVRLNRLRAVELAAEADADDPDGIPYLRFDAAAQTRFDQWRGLLENRLRRGTDHTAIEAHLAEFRSLIPSLALLIHLAEDRVGRVGYEALERAIGWGRYLESHARRIYSIAIAPDTAEAVALPRKLLARELKDGIALRDVYRRGWIGLNSKESAARAVEMLCDLDWLTETVEKTPDRSRTRYRINPGIQKNPLGGTDRTDRSPLLSVLSVHAERKTDPSMSPSTKSADQGTRPAAELTAVEEVDDEPPDEVHYANLPEVNGEAGWGDL